MSRKLVVDRFEGTYVICEDAEQRLFALETAEMPAGIKEGDVLEIGDDGTLCIDQQETERRRENNKNLQDRLWK